MDANQSLPFVHIFIWHGDVCVVAWVLPRLGNLGFQHVPLLTDGELNPSLDPSQSCEYSVTAIDVGFITTVFLVLG